MHGGVCRKRDAHRSTGEWGPPVADVADRHGVRVRLDRVQHPVGHTQGDPTHGCCSGSIVAAYAVSSIAVLVSEAAMATTRSRVGFCT